MAEKPDYPNETVPLEDAIPGRDGAPTDGRIYLVCDVCGERIAVYRHFPADTHLLSKRRANPDELVNFLARHAMCVDGDDIYNNYPTYLPSLSWRYG